MFAKGFVKENQVLERLGTQKHEHAIGELDLKCCKLENKAMEKQHQCECDIVSLCTKAFAAAPGWGQTQVRVLSVRKPDGCP